MPGIIRDEIGLPRPELFVDGAWIAADTAREILDPATGAVVASVGDRGASGLRLGQ